MGKHRITLPNGPSSNWADLGRVCKEIGVDPAGIAVRGLTQREGLELRVGLIRGFQKLCSAGLIRVQGEDGYCMDDVAKWSYLFLGNRPPVIRAMETERQWKALKLSMSRFLRQEEEMRKQAGIKKRRRKKRRSTSGGGSARSIPKVKYKIRGGMLKPSGMGVYGKGRRR